MLKFLLFLLNIMIIECRVETSAILQCCQIACSVASLITFLSHLVSSNRNTKCRSWKLGSPIYKVRKRVPHTVIYRFEPIKLQIRAVLMWIMQEKLNLLNHTSWATILSITVNKQILFRRRIKFGLEAGNSCYYSVQTLVSSRLLSKILQIKTYKTIILPVAIWLWKMISYIKGGMQVKGVWKGNPKAYIWAQEGCEWGMEKVPQWGI